MTIAAGALWPWWGESGLPSPPVPGLRPQAAIIVSDSRWTFTGGSAPPSDTGAVYAGHAEAGEEALARLASRFAKSRVERRNRELVARDVFRDVYRRHRTQLPLRILVGYCNPQGFAGLTYFGSENSFVPTRESGIYVIAWPGSDQGFRDGLGEVVRETIVESQGGLGLSPDAGLMAVGIAARKFVIEPGTDPSVGGSVQLGMADHRGFKTYRMVKAPGAAAGMPLTWETITPEPGELRTRKPRGKKA